MHWLYQGTKVASPTLPFVPLGQAYDVRLTLVVPSTDDDVGKVYLCLTDKDYVGQIYAKKGAEWAYKELMPFPYASCLIGTLTSGQRVDIDFRIILEDGTQAGQFNIPMAVCCGDDVIEAMPSGVWCGSDEHEPGLWGEDHESRPLWLGGVDQCPFHEDGSICVGKDFHWLESGETLVYGDVIYIKPSDRAMYKASNDAETAEGAYAIGLVADGSADLVERFDSAAWADEDNMLIFDHGGEVDGSIVNTLSIYDPTTRTWSEGAAGGGARKLHSAVVYDGKAYIYGGIQQDEGTYYSNSLYSYDLTTGEWTSLGTGGTARAEFTMSVISGKIYFVGGYNDSGSVTTLDIYDISEGTWTTGDGLSEGDTPSITTEPEELTLSPHNSENLASPATNFRPAWVTYEKSIEGGTETVTEMWVWGPSGEAAPYYSFLIADKDGSLTTKYPDGDSGDFPDIPADMGFDSSGGLIWADDGNDEFNFDPESTSPNMEWDDSASAPGTTTWYSRFQASYGGYLYDASTVQKKNLTTDTWEAWSVPGGIDTDYTILGAKDGYVYLVDVETYNAGEGNQTRLVLWLYNIGDDTWAKTTFDSYPWSNYERVGYELGHTGLADDDAIYILTSAYGVTGELDYGDPVAQYWSLVKIPMLSGEGAASYIAASGSNIYRINPSTNTVETYNASTDSWSDAVNVSADLPSGGLVSLFGNNLYLVGGEDALGNPNDQTYILNPTSGVVNLSDANITSPHIGGNSVSLGGGVYTWGGHGSGYQTSMDVVDLSANAWESWDLAKRKIQTQGFFTNESWNWTPGAALYLSTDGNMQESRPSSGHMVKIGKAISAQTICIDPVYIEYIEPPPG